MDALEALSVMESQETAPGGAVSATTAAARALAAKRHTGLDNCEVCGKPFFGLKARRYCSHRCAQRAYKARRRNRASWLETK